MQQVEEIWKDVVGYEGLYQVSNLGRVKSLSRELYTPTGQKYNTIEKILKPNSNKNYSLYLTISISKNNIKKALFIHRVIAKSFLPNPLNKPCVNHKNGIKHDNRVENLEWCTQSENVQHAFDTKLKFGMKGENHPRVKLTNEDVIEIRKMLTSPNQTLTSIGDKFGVNRTTIARIRDGIVWSHL